MKFGNDVFLFHRAALKASSRYAIVLLAQVAGCAPPVPAQPVHGRPPAASSAPPRNDALPAASSPVPALAAAAPPAVPNSPVASASSSAVIDPAAPAGPSTDGAVDSAHGASGAQPTTPAPPPNSRNPPIEVKRPTLWYCYVWAHLRFTTQDCFDTIKECREHLPKEGMALRPCMAQKKPAWCTEPYDVPEDPNEKRSSKCFGSEDACDQYRMYVHGNGLESTPCVEAETK